MSEAKSVRAPFATRALLEPPGGILMWIVVALELVTFGIILLIVAGFRASEPSVFAAGQRLLDPSFGLGLTLTLLTSGWLVAEAVHSVRLERLVRARWLYAAGIGMGLVFVGLKAYDYLHKRALGLGLDDDFGAAYTLATGFHLAHVLVGLVMLVYGPRGWGVSRSSTTRPRSRAPPSSGTCATSRGSSSFLSST